MPPPVLVEGPVSKTCAALTNGVRIAEALALPPQLRHVEWCRTGVAMLLLLSFNGIHTAGKPPAAQTIKPAHLIDMLGK